MAELQLKDIKGAVDAIGAGFEEFKSTHEQSLKTRDALLDAKLVTISEDITKKYGEVKDAQAALEAKFNRPGGLPNSEDGKAVTKLHAGMNFVGKALGLNRLANATSEECVEYAKTYGIFLRVPEAGMSLEQRKSMSVGSDPDGGYWVAPPEIDSQIRTRIFETSPMRKVCDQQTISTHEYKVPEDPNELSVGWVGETTARTETNTPKIATKVITAHEVYGMPKVTQIFLEDAAINVEQWLANKIGDKIGRFTNTSFLRGTGVAQPRGLLTYPAGTNSDGSNKWGEIEQVVSGASGTFAYDSLVQMITSIKDPYQDGAEWLMRRQSLSTIMTLKDGGGRYIFQPILNGAFNNTPLLGYNINYASDMDAVGTSGAFLAAFGNFKRGYLIVDRVGVSTLRDNLTQKGFILFYTRMRTGGDVVDYDAIKLYKAT